MAMRLSYMSSTIITMLEEVNWLCFCLTKLYIYGPLQKFEDIMRGFAFGFAFV